MLTTGEVARIFEVPPAAIRRWCQQGKIKYRRPGLRGHRGFSREDVAVAYLDRCIQEHFRRKINRS